MGRFHERVAQGFCGMCGARALTGERRKWADGSVGPPYQTCKDCRTRMRKYSATRDSEERQRRRAYGRAYRLKKKLALLQAENEIRKQKGLPLRPLPDVAREIESTQKIERARREVKLKNLQRRIKELERQLHELRGQAHAITLELATED